MGQSRSRGHRERESGFIPNFSKEMAGCSTQAPGLWALQPQKPSAHRPAIACHVPLPTHPAVVGLGGPCRTPRPCLPAPLECVSPALFHTRGVFKTCGISLQVSASTFIAATVMSTTEEPINNMNVPHAGPFMGPTLFDLLICKIFYRTTQLSLTAG